LKRDGLFELGLKYFAHGSDGDEMEWEGGYPTIGKVYSTELERLLGPHRRPDEPLTEFHEDVAHSLQAVYETCVFHVLNGLWKRTKASRLCLAGGCAMNSVVNGKIRSETPFEEIYVQPAARLLAEGNVIGWFQGRMEWGARALGNRSILADPRRADMRDLINEKIKLRERFRPFAPSILESAVSDYFVDPAPDPFMQQV